MGTRYTKKNLGDPNWSKPNNYKIKQNDAIYDVEIVPNKGVKGDISAQPFNDKNAEDIENALVSLDDDLAFVEADYINNAEHALKQNITDNGLNTTNKTVVGAINEVKSEGEYHDLLQDDAIAIVNNKINALPMNGSLKNIRTSLVGIPTTFTNIDMFNTKQTVTNYQPLSLDYKGAANPEVILMKTIGDYTFDFAIEATHTNGTDTTIILEAWVDGVLYDTATRTLVGGSNQINGITGFFTYSKGTDTVPSEIYFRFRASQGNTSANKALINTNLQGNSATMSFTDTDHVTGVSLNEPTYNGATTSFIINDIRWDVNTNQSDIAVLEDTVVKSVNGIFPVGGDVIAKQIWSLDELELDGTWVINDVPGNIKKAVDKVVSIIGNDVPFTIIQGLYRGTAGVSAHFEFSQAIEDSIISEYGKGIGTLAFEFEISFGLINDVINYNIDTGNFIKIRGNNMTEFSRLFDFDNWTRDFWVDKNGAPHCEVVCEIKSDMMSTRGFNLDAKYRGYISGMTFWVGHYDAPSTEWHITDANVRYIPRVQPLTPPSQLSSGIGDTLLTPVHSMLGSTRGGVNPVVLTEVANMYFRVLYANAAHTYPNGIMLEGELGTTNVEQVMGMVVIHYGNTNWDDPDQKAPYVAKVNETPSILNLPTISDNIGLPQIETPNIVPEVGDNMQDTNEVATND